MTVVLPFTMQDLMEEYMALSTADQRENFWKKPELRMGPLTDEQKTVFAFSCAQSMEELSESIAQKTEKIDRLTVVQK